MTSPPRITTRHRPARSRARAWRRRSATGRSTRPWRRRPSARDTARSRAPRTTSSRRRSGPARARGAGSGSTSTMTLRAAMPSTAKKPTTEPSVTSAAGRRQARRRRAPRTPRSQRARPASSCRRRPEQQEDRDQPRRPRAQQATPVDCCWTYSPSDLGVVLEREVDRPAAPRPRAATAARSARDVAPRSSRRETDSGGSRRTVGPARTSATSSRRTCRRRGVDQHLADAGRGSWT